MADLISRCELFNRLASVEKSADVVKIINGMPTSEPEVVRWIPCSEKLPDKDGYYLVTCERFGWNAERDVFTDIVELFRGSWIEPGKVIAWMMPLPEPYKRGDADDQR